MRSEVEKAFELVFSQLDLSMDAFGLEEPPEGVGSVLASNISYRLQSKMGKSPDEISRLIAEMMHSNKFRYIERVYADGAYINFEPNENYFKETLEKASESNYGKFEDREELVIVEHTSANPTGPVHVGRARNPIIGDSIARILSFSGYEVERQYYVNDSGKQVATLVLGCEKYGEDEIDSFGSGEHRLNLKNGTKPSSSFLNSRKERGDYDLVRYYQLATAYLERSGEDEKKEIETEITEMINRIESGDEDIYVRLTGVVKRVLEGMCECLERMSVEFDEFVRETGFLRDGSVETMIKRLKDLDGAFEEDNAWKLSLHGSDKPLVFLRSDGTSLYTTRDLCYHEWKLERADRIVTVLGEDHKFQAQQLMQTLSMLGSDTDRIKQVFYSWVTLPEGGMSTRRGTGIKLDDLIDEATERARQEVIKRKNSRIRDEILNDSELDRIARQVGIGAIRYGIVSTQPGKGITFRWEDALNFDGQGSPYIQYVHARCCGILSGSDMNIETADLRLLTSDEERILINEIARFPSVVLDASESLEPHRIAAYAKNLAEKFNIFYRECPVLKAESKNLKESRLILVSATKNTVSNALYLIGIESPVSM